MRPTREDFAIAIGNFREINWGSVDGDDAVRRVIDWLDLVSAVRPGDSLPGFDSPGADMSEPTWQQIRDAAEYLDCCSQDFGTVPQWLDSIADKEGKRAPGPWSLPIEEKRILVREVIAAVVETKGAAEAVKVAIALILGR